MVTRARFFGRPASRAAPRRAQRRVKTPVAAPCWSRSRLGSERADGSRSQRVRRPPQSWRRSCGASRRWWPARPETRHQATARAGRWRHAALDRSGRTRASGPTATDAASGPGTPQASARGPATPHRASKGGPAGNCAEAGSLRLTPLLRSRTGRRGPRAHHRRSAPPRRATAARAPSHRRRARGRCCGRGSPRGWSPGCR